jgi:hypothetical protein
MSTVAGFVNKNGVWIGVDSAATTDSGERRPIITNKLFRNEEYLIACTGSVRGCQVLHPAYFEPPEEISYLADAIRCHYKELGCISLSTEDQTESHLSNFLIGYRGKLYEILIDFQINEIPEYCALGSGSSFAFGVFYYLRNSNLKPEQKIKAALESACEFDLSTAPPIIIEKL